MPRLQGRAPEAGSPRRHGQRPVDRRCQPLPDPHRPGILRGDGGRSQQRSIGPLHQPRVPHRPPDPQGNPRTTRLPGRCRARLPDAGAIGEHPLRRRGPAHSPRHADRLQPDGRALHPRRTQHRPPPARQRPAHQDPGTAPRHRQHAHRGRARRRHHARRRLDRRYRARRGRARWPCHRRRRHGRHRQQHLFDHRRLPERPPVHSHPQHPPPRQRQVAHPPRRPREQPPRHLGPVSARHVHLHHWRLWFGQELPHHRYPPQATRHGSPSRSTEARLA